MEHLNVSMCIFEKYMVTSYVIIKYKYTDCDHFFLSNVWNFIDQNKIKLETTKSEYRSMYI